jgi:hypothetical protein
MTIIKIQELEGKGRGGVSQAKGCEDGNLNGNFKSAREKIKRGPTSGKTFRKVAMCNKKSFCDCERKDYE